MGPSRVQWCGAWIECPKDQARQLSLTYDESISTHILKWHKQWMGGKEHKLWWVVCLFSEDLGAGLKADIGPGNSFANRNIFQGVSKKQKRGEEFWREGEKEIWLNNSMTGERSSLLSLVRQEGSGNTWGHRESLYSAEGLWPVSS